MKKHGATLLTVLFALVLFLSVNCILTTQAASVNDLTYQITNGEATITDCNSDASGKLTIPNTIEGYPVTSIGWDAFSNCTSLTSVKIPNSVTSIDGYAFADCDSLTSVTIPDSVTSIAEGAFYYCSKLTSVTIGNSVTSIGDWTFSGCDSLTSVTIPDSVISIGSYAFYYCSKLTSVTIGNSVTSIGSSAFSGCESLTYNISNTGKYLGNTKNPYFVLMDTTTKDITSFTTHKNTKIIASGAFYDCTSLNKITISNSVISIGGSAFYNCDSLTSVKIPNSVTSIGSYAFYNCDSLTSVTIPDSVTSIAEGAFYYCSKLTSVTIGNSVTSIGSSAFSGCESLTYNISNTGKYLGNTKNPYFVLMDTTTKDITSFTTHKNTKIIASGAFYDCTSLNKITISNSVISIGGSAFYNCDSLTSVTIPDSVTSIAEGAFYNCTSLTSVTIPDSVTSMGGYAFSGCDSLTSVKIPNSVTSIGHGAFSNCTSLTSVKIPNSVTSIGDWTFSGCDSLTSVTIPDSVTGIGYGVFSGCTSLTSITIPDGVTYIGSEPFYGCSALTGIWVDKNNKNYSNDSKGVLFNKDKTILLQAPGALSGSYTIPKTVCGIDSNAFYDCDKLTSVSIPSSVTSIRQHAFDSCSKLTTIKLPSNVTGILYSTFANCTNLKSVGIPKSVTSIQYDAFSSCDRLADVYYSGKQTQWEQISINQYGNDPLLKATLHINHVFLEITKQPAKQENIAGETAKFTVKATGTGLKYQWQYRSSSKGAWKKASTTGSKTATLRVPATAARNGYQYRCKITDKYGNVVYSNAATLKIVKLKVTTQPANKYLPAGKTAKFTVKVSGTGLKYQWQYRTSAKGSWKNASATGNKTATLSVPVTAARNNYQYRCKITDQEGSVVYSNAATLKVVTLKVTAQPASKYLPAGKTAKFTVKVSGTGLKYQWQYRTSAKGAWKKASATGNKTATLKVPVTAARNGYQYRCVITDKYGNVVGSKAATLKVK